MSKLDYCADIYFPGSLTDSAAFSSTTHLGIGAHQDDLEFMAFHGIAECFYSETKWFGGIICTDGSGSARVGPYAGIDDDEMRRIRMGEQRCAASVGNYSFVAQLGFPSPQLNSPIESELVERLVRLMGRMKPEVVYTHCPSDKHETHIRVLIAVLESIRRLPSENRPRRLLGCEAWRGLDWVDDRSKIVLDVGGYESLAAALSGVFDSQIAGGKRYDLAIAGRRRANATLIDSHAADALTEASLAMDLTPLIGADPAKVVDFTLDHVQRFSDDVRTRLGRSLARP